MIDSGQKYRCPLLMRAAEQADIVGLPPDHQVRNLYGIVGLSDLHSRFHRRRSFIPCAPRRQDTASERWSVSARRFRQSWKSICWDAFTTHSTDTTPWYNKKMQCIFLPQLGFEINSAGRNASFHGQWQRWLNKVLWGLRATAHPKVAMPTGLGTKMFAGNETKVSKISPDVFSQF